MRQTQLSSVWTRETAVLNFIARVSLECMSWSDGECRSVSYGVMNIRKLVTIVQKCKMGGCEHHYLSMTWAAPIHSKIGMNKAPKRGKWVVHLSWFACEPARKDYFPPEKMNWMHADLQIEVENRFLIDDWKTPVWHVQGQYFLITKERSFW